MHLVVVGVAVGKELVGDREGRLVDGDFVRKNVGRSEGEFEGDLVGI